MKLAVFSAYPEVKNAKYEINITAKNNNTECNCNRQWRSLMSYDGKWIKKIKILLEGKFI